MPSWRVDATAVAASSAVFTVDGGILGLITYPARVIRAGYLSCSLGAKAGPLPYGEFYAHVGDTVFYGIDWAGWLANPWQRGANVPPGTAIRPRIPTGYQMLSVLGGQSGNYEPIWPNSLGQTVYDGSTLWVSQAIDNTSLSAIVQSVFWTAPVGITIDRREIYGEIVIGLLDAGTAVAGTDYAITAATTMSDGETKVGSIVLKVR